MSRPFHQAPSGDAFANRARAENQLNRSRAAPLTSANWVEGLSSAPLPSRKLQRNGSEGRGREGTRARARRALMSWSCTSSLTGGDCVPEHSPVCLEHRG